MKAELTIESFVEQAGRDGLVEGGQGSSCNIHAFLSFLLRVLGWPDVAALPGIHSSIRSSSASTRSINSSTGR